MDLKHAKAAWQRARLEFIREKPIAERIAEIERKAEEEERKFKRDLHRQLLFGTLCLILMACGFDRRLSVFSNVGLGVMILCLAIGIGSSYVLKRRLREYHPELPDKEFLAEERGMITAKINLLRCGLRYLLPAGLLGLFFWQAFWSRTYANVLVILSIAVISYITALFFGRRKIKELMPILEEIDQEIAESD